jgi:cytochrome c5
MHTELRIEAARCTARFERRLPARMGLVALAFAGAMFCLAATAQHRERSGQEVVDAVCAACHAKGVNGAPMIGDEKAWAARASQGLTTLTEHALQGIRNMPAHGGNMAVSDIEIERAITQMVNQSGGHWVEPLGGATPAVVRSGEQIVRAQCSKCHQDGVSGAPKIGDRAAWIPRLKKGLDALVQSAVHGHGPMPARGGIADLTDLEIQGAVVYMFNYGLPVVAAAPAKAVSVDPYHKVVAGTEVYLGIVRADAVPEGQRKSGAPTGKGEYYLNVSLADSKTRATITDAQVKLSVADPFSAQTRDLELVAANGMVSYGGYFRMLGPEPYKITARIQRPGTGRVIETQFEYKVW